MKRGSKVPYKPRKYNIIKTDLIKYYKTNKLTCKQIALIYGCSWSTIRQALIRNGIKLRKPLSGKVLARNHGHKTRFKINHKMKSGWGFKKGELPISFKGKFITSKGYIYRYSPNHPNRVYGKHVAEHRLVMEKYLGRYLTKKEIIHHRNKNKKDNRLKNLKLCKSNGMHQHLHKKAYDYLIKINKIDDYIKWFEKEYEKGK